MITNPLLLNIPMPIKTSRIILRPFMPGDGIMINKAIHESFEELTQWMPWADHKPTLDETEENVRQLYAKWILRENLSMVILDSSTGNLLGCSGYNEIDWRVPKLNIGYWIRTSCAGKGFATETANVLTRYAFDQLNVARVEINADVKNIASIRVIEKLNFEKEGILKHNRFYPQAEIPNDTAIYARFDTDGLPPLEISW